METAAGQNILILRTAAMWQFRACAERLAAEHPGARITAVCQKSAAAEAAASAGVSDVIEIPDGPVNIFKLPLASILKKSGKPDLLVALYNDPEGLEYFHIDALALIIPAREKLIHDRDGSFRPFPATGGDPAAAAATAAKKLWYAAYTRPLDMTLMPHLTRAAMLIKKIRGAARGPGGRNE